MVTRYSVGGRPPVLPLKAARPAIRTAVSYIHPRDRNGPTVGIPGLEPGPGARFPHVTTLWAYSYAARGVAGYRRGSRDSPAPVVAPPSAGTTGKTGGGG